MAADFRPPELDGAGVTAKLGQQAPMELTFRNEAGQTVKLRDLTDNKPTILILAYFKCPLLCTQVLNGTFEALQSVPVETNDYQIVVVSFDPRETPEMAAMKKDVYLGKFNTPTKKFSAHFLTGEQPAIDALTQAVGFSYSYDKLRDQFVHPGMVTMLTPEGKISRYFFGIRFQPRDLRLGLVESSAGKIGTRLDQVVLFCLAYDPAGGTYAAAILRLMRTAGALTVLVIVTALIVAFRREKKRNRVLTGAMS